MDYEEEFCEYCGDFPAKRGSIYCGDYCRYRNEVVVPRKKALIKKIVESKAAASGEASSEAQSKSNPLPPPSK